MATNAIRAEGLTKNYGELRALAGFDLEVPQATVCGVLGPNGAGKTTAVRVLTTLLRPDAGRAEVAGIDVVRRPLDVRARIGLVGQHAAVDEVLGGRQNLVLFGRLHGLGGAAARRRADELLEQFELADVGPKAVADYSGGMRRRLDLAASLIVSPPVLFFDEPTTGLDPRSRGEVWRAIRELVDGGTTLLLTTQYLEEADQLADQLAVVDHGRVVARGTPTDLKARVGGDRLDVVLLRADQLSAARDVLGGFATGVIDVDADALRLSAPVEHHVRALTGVVQGLADRGIDVEDVGVRRPTLDEAFLMLTGRPRAEQEVAA